MRLRGREISPVELLEATLTRIEALDAQLRTFITLDREAAMRAALAGEEEIGRGRYRGPLHGVPIALKDVIDASGMRTTSGSKRFVDAIPVADAAVVRKLKQAGAVLIGKNNMHEFAMGSTTANPYYGVCRNPWNPAHVPGGSSGGSGAALAAGLCFAAIASDTAGSIRSPASQCGVAGLKPTAGLVSTQGVIAVSPTLDHVGPMARRADDLLVILQAIAERPLDGGSPDARLAGTAIGVPRSYFFEGISAEVDEAVRSAIGLLRDLGAAIHEVAWPSARESADAALLISAYEALERHAGQLRSCPEDYSPELRARLASAGRIGRAEYEQALARVPALKAGFVAAMERVDFLAVPTNPVPPPRHGEETILLAGEALPIGSVMPRLGAPFNLIGCPALSVPCGFSRAGLPIGLQLVARPLCDAALISLAAAYEEAAGWHRYRPSITRQNA